jgi:hypothetical protein
MAMQQQKQQMDNKKKKKKKASILCKHATCEVQEEAGLDRT